MSATAWDTTACDLLGVTEVAPIDLAEAARRIEARPAGAPFGFVVTPNAQHIALLRQPGHPLATAYAAAWLRVNDSRVLSRLTRLATGRALPVVNGSDLTLRLLHGLSPEDPVTIIGGDADLAARLGARFGLRNLAWHAPPMGFIQDPAARRAAVRFIFDNPARYVFVVTGAPRSEQLLAEVAATGHAVGTGLAVGSALDFATGRLKRAPESWQRAGLEWLHRLLEEPGRLWRRYLVECPVVFALAARQWARRARG